LKQNKGNVSIRGNPYASMGGQKSLAWLTHRSLISI